MTSTTLYIHPLQRRRLRARKAQLYYGYRKLTSPKNRPACSACDITHGGLRFEESAAWKEVKMGVENEGRDMEEVRQMHRDEFTAEVGVYYGCC